MRTPQNILEAIDRFRSVDWKTRIAPRKAYDDFHFKQLWSDKRRVKDLKLQKIDSQYYLENGADAAVARFVTGYCGGRIKTTQGNWFANYYRLPKQFDEEFKIAVIEAPASNLYTESIANFAGLTRLERMDLSRNDKLDNFACDQLARAFRTSKTLKELNLSHIPRIDVYGLDALFRIPSLRLINAQNTMATRSEDIELFTIAALEERNCIVLTRDDGRLFKSPELEELYKPHETLLLDAAEQARHSGSYNKDKRTHE